MPGLGLSNRRAARAAACIAAALLLLPVHGALGSGAGGGSGTNPAKNATPGSDAAASHPPGTVIRDCGQCPELVVVPAGAFRMGDLSGGGDVDERPARTVTIPRAFAIARYETTFAEWDACVAAGACRQGVDDVGFGRGRRPAMLVGWEDARAYAGWLSRRTGKPYRLPSEAEWEYAARAGGGTRFPWGDEVGTGRANCDQCGSRWDDAMTAPVGSFPANAFGLHDVVGNVYEWVADCGGASYEGAPSDGSAHDASGGGGNCQWRVMRGGSWLSLPRASRPANRVRNPAGFRDVHTGFRVARSLF